MVQAPSKECRRAVILVADVVPPSIECIQLWLSPFRSKADESGRRGLKKHGQSVITHDRSQLATGQSLKDMRTIEQQGCTKDGRRRTSVGQRVGSALSRGQPYNNFVQTARSIDGSASGVDRVGEPSQDGPLADVDLQRHSDVLRG